MNPFVMSQTYLQKTELISECIIASATLGRSINDRDVLIGLLIEFCLVHTRQLLKETKINFC